MIKERCFGIIPLQKKEDWEVLLVLHKKGLYWAFPKGHKEGEETDKETAKRELIEETNLKLKFFLKYPPLEEQYQFVRKNEKINKKVSYYPALVEGKGSRQTEEIVDMKWFSLESAIKKISFETSREMIKSFFSFLENEA